MKRIFFTLTALLSMNLMAQTQMHVHMKDGSTVDYFVNDVDCITWSELEKPDDPEVVAEAVDLGLPSCLKWANCNIGANSPEEYGYFFAWGETEPKSYFDDSNYKWYGDNRSMTKYNYSDQKDRLELEDDAAHVCWGGSWRMPTDEEFNELKTSCSWTWTTRNGINGYSVEGPNGNAVFFPAAGMKSDDDYLYKHSEGCYWTSTKINMSDREAYFFTFSTKRIVILSDHRSFGFTIRPVCE